MEQLGQVKQESFVSATIGRLDSQNSKLQKAVIEIRSLNDRAFGPDIKEKSGSDSVKNGAQGSVHEIVNLITTYQNLVDELLSEVSKLSRIV